MEIKQIIRLMECLWQIEPYSRNRNNGLFLLHLHILSIYFVFFSLASNHLFVLLIFRFANNSRVQFNSNLLSKYVHHFCLTPDAYFWFPLLALYLPLCIGNARISCTLFSVYFLQEWYSKSLEYLSLTLFSYYLIP